MAPMPALLVTPVEAQKSLTASGVLTTRKPKPIEAIKAINPYLAILVKHHTDNDIQSTWLIIEAL